MSKKRPAKAQPTIALCVIARNEEQFIGDCLDSARPFVDELVVLDTGSTDRTREIARAHGARVEEFVWCEDFAAARNAAIDAATADWIFMLDADERLEPESGPVLRGLPGRMPRAAHAACPRIESRSLSGTGAYSIAGQVPRFFRRSPDIRYVGAIHEDIVYVPNPAATTNVVASQLRVTHYGYDNTIYATRQKDQRNTELLERQLAQHPDDPRLLFFLAQQHHAMDRHGDAIEYYQRFLASSESVRPGFVVEVYAMLIKSLGELEWYAELDQVVQIATVQNLLNATAYEALAATEERRSHHARALACLQRALDGNLPDGLTQDGGTAGWATRLRLAELHERMGNQRAALDQLELAYGELASDKRGVVSRQAAALAVRAGAAGDALRWLERARRDATDENEAQQTILELALRVRELTPLAPLDAVERAVAAEDWQAAYDAARALPPSGAASYVRLLLVAARLRELGAPDAALSLLERAMDCAPDNQLVYWELVRTLTDLGRYAEAQLAVEALQGTAKQAA